MLSLAIEFLTQIIGFLPIAREQAYSKTSSRDDSNFTSRCCAFPRKDVGDAKNEAPTHISALVVAISISIPNFGREERDLPNVSSSRSIPELYFRVNASEFSSHNTIVLEKAKFHVRSCYKTAYTRTTVLLPYTYPTARISQHEAKI